MRENGGMRFEWDGSRAAANLKEHRVSFDEAVTVSMTLSRRSLEIPITLSTRVGLSRSATRPEDDSWSPAMLSVAEQPG